MSDAIATEVLVVGGGTGGTAAAIQAARRGAQTVLVSELPWLGGMLTAAGVAAPDGNELLAFQTGLWGAFLRELWRRQPGGLDHAWVSFFTYEPRVGAAIFANWVRTLPNLLWIPGKVPRGVLRRGDRILGVEFDGLRVCAQITLDGTELGDLLALGSVPYRWGWEAQRVFGEPSAPRSLTDPTDPLFALTQTYPVQSPTWVVLLQEAAEGQSMPRIMPAAAYDPQQFQGAWQGYGAAQFLNYGRLPRGQFMVNWPHQGNDYGVDLHRLVAGEAAWQAWAEAAIAHSHNFAHFIQTALGDRYGLATQAFPTLPGQLGGGAFALMPYYREGRRLVGVTTVTEGDILPCPNGRVAPLPVNGAGVVSSIAIGNYPNDHHYPGFQLPLAAKTTRWGGRWTGTPFALPYEAIVPATVDGLLVCDKAISVSHIANGATRLQPVVLGLGQAAGMAAALCVERGCEPRELPVGVLQTALLEEAIAPAAVVPLWNHLPGWTAAARAHWRSRQQFFLSHPEDYPASGWDAVSPPTDAAGAAFPPEMKPYLADFEGVLHREATEEPAAWQAHLVWQGQRIAVVTGHPAVHESLQHWPNQRPMRLRGLYNPAGNWLRVLEVISD